MPGSDSPQPAGAGLHAAPGAWPAGAAGPGQALDRELEEGFRDLLRMQAERSPGGSPPRLFFAPGRVNLMGAHLDYNGGVVMPTAIDRGTFIAARPLRGQIRLVSQLEGLPFEAPLPPGAWDLEPTGAWFDYPLGVLREAQRAGQLSAGVELHFGGNLPIGAGLSSSASICVGTAYAVEQLFGSGSGPAGPPGWVAHALASERDFVGVKCGIMDPFAVAFSRAGQLLCIDCSDRSIEHLPFPAERITIGICDSGVRRELAAGAFNQRVQEAEALFRLLAQGSADPGFLRAIAPARFHALRSQLPAALARRGDHIFGEFERTGRARTCLEAGDLAGFGALLTETHASLRENYEVSTPELDLLVDLAVAQEGVYGSRLTGAGFGGCTALLLEPGSEQGAALAIRAGFRARFGREPGVRFYRGDPGPREIFL